MIKQFAANNLALSLDKINTMKFITNTSAHSTLHIGYKEYYVVETVNTKFIGLQIDNHINWMNHTEKMIPKLSGACYPASSVVYISNINTLKSVYCAYFHSIIKYEIIFWAILPTVRRFSLYKNKSSDL
jgi:predicted metallopeptidase